MTKRLFLPLLFATLGWGLFVPGRALAEADPYAVCQASVSRAERSLGIPAGLLTAISTVESGRWDKERGASLAWPWTVTSGGNGQFFATKQEAVAEVRRMRAQGIRNIDVGCMQVNLHHHAGAFENLEEAFDPASNAAYAAQFLRSLYETHQDWLTAASYYHSATPELGARYRSKVLAAWTGAPANGDAPAVSPPLIQTADWTLARPAQPADAHAQPQVRLASTAPVQRPALAQSAFRSAPQPPAKAHMESSREEARAFATAWRAARLAEYRQRKAAQGGV